VRELAASGLVVLAGKGHAGAGEHVRTPYKGQEQARLAEGRQPCSRPAPRPRRTRQRPVQVPAHPAQASLLPLEGRSPGQGHPCRSDPRDAAINNAQPRPGGPGCRGEPHHDYRDRPVQAAAAYQLRRLRGAFPRHRTGLPRRAGAIRKQFIYAEDGWAGGVYLWQTRAAAEAFYTGPWLEGIRERYGMDPQIKFFETACITDNAIGAVLLPDAAG